MRVQCESSVREFSARVQCESSNSHKYLFAQAIALVCGRLKATLALLRFHFDPFLFLSCCFLLCSHFPAFFSVHTTPFSDRNGYLSIGVHTISQKRICFSLSENEAFKASDIGVFKMFRFWCSHYRVAFLFSSVFI